MKGKEFFNLCEEEFSYLMKNFNFKISNKNQHKWGYQIFMKNSTTGVIITFEFRDFYVFLKICKLENGAFVDDIKEIRSNSRINNFDYENLLLIRSPESIYPEYNDDTIFDDNLVKKIVKHHSENLRKNSHDVLNGDFTVFKELEKIVKKRAGVGTTVTTNGC